MSAVIKSGFVDDRVHSIGGGDQAPILPISKYDEERSVLQKRITGLEREIRTRDAELADVRMEVGRSFEDGREQGYHAGLSEAQDRQTDRLAALEKAFTSARREVTDWLEGLSNVSVVLAQECLDIILGDAQDRAENIRRIIETQIAKVDGAMLIDVQLSRLDFPDDAALSGLSERLGRPLFNLVASHDLPSGSCTMTLSLGKIDVGIGQQWGVLRSALEEIISPGRKQ